MMAAHKRRWLDVTDDGAHGDVTEDVRPDHTAQALLAATRSAGRVVSYLAPW
jgi:hypothetical protein